MSSPRAQVLARRSRGSRSRRCTGGCSRSAAGGLLERRRPPRPGTRRVGRQRRRGDHAHELPVAGRRVLARAERCRRPWTAGASAGAHAGDRDDRARARGAAARAGRARRPPRPGGRGCSPRRRRSRRRRAARRRRRRRGRRRTPAAHAPPRGLAIRSDRMSGGKTWRSTRREVAGRREASMTTSPPQAKTCGERTSRSLPGDVLGAAELDAAGAVDVAHARRCAREARVARLGGLAAGRGAARCERRRRSWAAARCAR